MQPNLFTFESRCATTVERQARACPTQNPENLNAVGWLHRIAETLPVATSCERKENRKGREVLPSLMIIDRMVLEMSSNTLTRKEEAIVGKLIGYVGLALL
jgi:hypothetical protein